MAVGSTETQRPPVAAKPSIVPVDVLPLLRSYGRAIAASADPPASIRWPRRLRWIQRIRPKWGCRYFTVRYVRRQVQAIEGALGRRIAIGEHDADDEQELAALERFRSSLPPPPSRWLALAGLVVAILMAQALLGLLLRDIVDPGFGGAPERSRGNAIALAFRELDVSPDVQSLGDLARALAGGTAEELLVVLLTVTAIAYLFARPLAVGYGLSYMLLGRPGRRSRRHRGSDATRLGDEVQVDAKEAELAQQACVEFRRDPPVDLIAKSLLLLTAVFFLIAYARFDLEEPALLALGGAAVVARLAWLMLRLRSRRYPLAWIAAPVAVTCALALTAPSTLDAEWTDRDELAWARAADGMNALPRMSPSAARLMIGSTSQLDGLDLRGMDLPRVFLGGKSLRHSSLRFAGLRRADMRGADLREADLRGAYLAGANLRGADLRGADLSCANVRGATLRGATFDARTRVRGLWHSRTTRLPAGFLLEHEDVADASDGGWTADCSFFFE